MKTFCPISTVSLILTEENSTWPNFMQLCLSQELGLHHQSDLREEEAAVEGILLKKQTRAAPTPFSHIPVFSPSLLWDTTQCLTQKFGKYKFDQENKSLSKSSTKFTRFAERTGSSNSNGICDCKQTLILLSNCPILLSWNTWFYYTEKVSIFRAV